MLILCHESSATEVVLSRRRGIKENFRMIENVNQDRHLCLHQRVHLFLQHHHDLLHTKPSLRSPTYNKHYNLLHTTITMPWSPTYKTITTISYIQPSLRSPTYNHHHDLLHTTNTTISYIQQTLQSPTYNHHYDLLHTTITMISYIQPSLRSPTYNWLDKLNRISYIQLTWYNVMKMSSHWQLHVMNMLTYKRGFFARMER